jgi:hypothetical protein
LKREDLSELMRAPAPPKHAWWLLTKPFHTPVFVVGYGVGWVLRWPRTVQRWVFRACSDAWRIVRKIAKDFGDGVGFGSRST